MTNFQLTIQGVAFLHSQQICHRDLKPKNIFISHCNGTLRPRIKLSNFAFMRVSKNPVPLWKIVMSKSWMPPEIYNENTFTVIMDLFSLGLVFVYVLSRGLHAFGLCKEERILNIKLKQSIRITAEKFIGICRAAELFELISSMLNFQQEERPVALAVLNNSFFNKSAFVAKENYTLSTSVITQTTSGIKIYFIYVVSQKI